MQSMQNHSSQVSAGKKKRYLEVPKVTEFFAGQSLDVRAEYLTIVSHLERDGRLFAPEGEKVCAGLFAIRIITVAV